MALLPGMRDLLLVISLTLKHLKLCTLEMMNLNYWKTMARMDYLCSLYCCSVGIALIEHFCRVVTLCTVLSFSDLTPYEVAGLVPQTIYVSTSVASYWRPFFLVPSLHNIEYYHNL